MFKQLRSNESGIILIIVLAVIMAMTVLAISTLSISMSTVSQIEDATMKSISLEIAKMHYWRKYYNMSYPDAHLDVIAGKTFNTQITVINSSPPQNIIINVTY